MSYTTYESNGQLYEVTDDRLEDFKRDHPNAKIKAGDGYTTGGYEVYYNIEDGKYKPYEVTKDRLEDFKRDFPEARTKEEWEDYAKKQKAEIENYNKILADNEAENEAELERKRIKDKEDEDKRRADLQTAHKEKIELRFKKEIESKYSPEQNWVSNPTKLEELRGYSYEQKVKWLNENTKEQYEAELSFDEPGFDIDESVLDETKLDMPQYINVMGVETSQPENSEDNKLGDNFLEDINKYNSDIQNILSNPILDDNGKVDYVKTQEAIDKIEANMPDGFELKSPEDGSVNWTEAELTKAYAEINKRISELPQEETERVISSENMTLDLDKAKNRKEEEDRITNEVFSELLEERKRKLEQYKKGEIDLTTEELATIATVDQGMKDYMKRFLPDAEQMVAMQDDTLSDNENVLNAVNSAVVAAVSSDPRFKFVKDGIVKEVNTQAEAKLIEIRNKYKLNEGITQEKLENVQKEFTDWYNNSIGEKLQSNKVLKRLYKEYGLAANSNFEEMSIDYKRFKDDYLRQLDDTLNRYEGDDSLKGQLKRGSAWIKEAIRKQPAAFGTMVNEIQIAARDLLFKSPAQEQLSNLEMVAEALESVTSKEAKDLTLDEITELLGEEGEAGKYANWLRNVKIMDGDVKLGDLMKETEDELTNIEKDDMRDVMEMLKAYEELSKFKTYDSGKAFGKSGSWADYFKGNQGLLPDFEFTLEGFLDRTAGLIDQAPHMVPSTIGKGLVGAAGVVTAYTGGAATPATSIMAKAGLGFIALGSMVQGAMEYGGTYMDGIRRGLTEELGREPTAEEYLEALKNPDKYTSQAAAIGAGAVVTGVEFLSDYLTGKLTGSIGGKIAETGIGKAILANTFTRYLASVSVSGLGGLQINAAQEYLTEGFQEYLGQVADNYIDKFAQGKEVDNIFTSNIRLDEIEEAAKMGYKQGELFGSVALISTTVGLSQIQKSYIQQAEDIAYNIDMRPGSATSKAGRAAFQRLQKAIEDDEGLSKSEKIRQINELSRIREASMLTPSNVTGLEKIKLMKLLIEQKQLKNEIKSVDNKELSVNKIERKAIVDQQIVNIIKGADERSSTVGMSILPTGQQQTVDTQSEQDSYSKIDKLIAEENLDLNNKFDQKRILKLAGGTIRSAFNRLYQEGGLLTKKEFQTRLENEYIQALTEYSAEQDVNNQGIGKQTSNLFGLRANAVASENVKNQGKTISMSDERAPQIGDTTEQVDFDAESEQVVGKREKKYMADNTKVSEAVGEEAVNQIGKETSQEILREAKKGKDATSIVQSLTNAFGQITARGGRGLFGIIGDKAGTLKKGFGDFVDKVVDRDFIAALPAAYLKQSTALQKILGLKKIGKTQVVKTDKDGKKTYSRPSVFAIPSDITDAQVQQVRDYFKNSPTAREGILKRLTQEFSLESINKLKQDKDFMQKLQTALGDKQSAVDFLNEIEAQLDQRNLEDTTKDIVAPKSAIDKLIARLEKTEKDYKNTLMLGISPGSFAQALRLALQAYQKGVKLGKSFAENIKQFIKAFKQAFKGKDKLTQVESKFIDKEVKRRFKNAEDMTPEALDNLIDDLAQKFGVDRGIAYEKAIYKSARKAGKNIPGFEIVGKQTEQGEGRDFDIQAKIWGFVFNIEAKLEKAIYGSANGIYNFITGEFKYSEQSQKMRSENKALADKLDKLLKKSKKKLDDFKRIAEALGFDLKKSGVIMDRDTYDNLIRETSTVFGKENITGDDLAAIYNAKDVYYIQIKGEGLYYLGENPLGLPVPKFEGTAELSMRIKAGSVEVKGAPNDRRITIVMDPTNFKRTGAKSDFTIDTEAGISKLMNTPEVELLKQQRETADKNANLAPDILNDKSQNPKKTFLQSLKARINALKINKKRKGLSAFDMDDTLALTKEKVIYTLDGKKSELTAAEFAVQYETLLEQGAEFDFSNFDNVDLSTPKGPLAGTALKRQAKYGTKDIYIVTARPKASQQAIKLWADSIGLNIPTENIITLEDGSPQAKADWLLGKAEQGYNDFYFADDSALNVQTVKDILSQIDVKSNVQQAISDKATRLDQEMNELIEDASGIGALEEVSDVRAKLEGKRKDKGFLKRILRQFTITSSADDFLGLGYALFGKGEKGSRQQKWFIKNLVEPYNKAEQALISAKMTLAADFNALKKAFPSLKSKKGGLINPLNQDIGVGPYNKSQAVRVYLWNKQGMEIPGIDKKDVDALVQAVNEDFELKQFADKIQEIQKQAEYPAPDQYWIAGDIKSDIMRSLDTTLRSELLTEFNENTDIIFSEKNMNKLEAAFGSKYVEALRDSLKRMKSGSNRPTYQGSGSRQVNEMMDWLNGSVAVAMFINVRSGLLQMLSNVNFINWGDNNIYAAAKAFMSKDYVPTVIKLMNSDYLVNRRDGLKINVNEAELAAAANKGGFKGMLAYLLDKGFILTRIFDTLAIATGGATFYINRTNSLLKQTNPETGKLYTKAEAEAKAFNDFYDIAENTQQSSNPSKISSQQASFFGRVILSFQNVTMQYNRKAKKMLLDLVNRRRRPGMTQRESDLSNLSGVIYYVGMQNLIFNALQQALFAVAFDDEEEKERDKVADTLNGMVDSLLFGLGFGGAIISTVKNVAREVLSQSERKTPKYEEAIWSLFDISPVIDSKIRNIRNGLKTFSWDMKEIKNRGWSLDNPAYIAISSVISGFTNIPLDRVFRKINNIRQATDENVRTFERIALLLGWSGWNFGLPYWGRESTIELEAANEEKLKEEFKISVKKAKANGFTKRVPFTGENSWQNGIPKGLKEGKDYVAIKRHDGIIQYYKKP